MGADYRDLVAWQKAMDLVTTVYKVSAKFPKEETFGLILQMRRAAVSVPSNIAEGQGRLGKKEFRQFLTLARGSLLELQTQAEIARNLEMLDHSSCGDLLGQSEEVKRLINGLIRSLSDPTDS